MVPHPLNGAARAALRSEAPETRGFYCNICQGKGAPIIRGRASKLAIFELKRRVGFVDIRQRKRTKSVKDGL